MKNLDECRFIFHRQANALDSAETSQSFGNVIQHALFVCADIATSRVTNAGSQLAGGAVWRRRAVGHGHRRIGLALGDAHADARRGPRQQVPEKRQPAARHRRGHITRRVSEADGKDLHVGRAVEQAGAKGQDGLAVGGCALGEDGDGTVGVLLEELLQGDELVVGGAARGGGRRGEGEEDGGKEADALDPAGARVGDGEDGVEDGGEVDGVDGARKVGGHDAPAVGEAVARLVGEGTALDAVELQVHPPDARDAHQAPEGDLARDDGQRQVVEEEEVAERKGDEEGDAHGKDDAMVEGAEGRERRRDGEEGRDAGRWWASVSEAKRSCRMLSPTYLGRETG